ncbi:endocuticle structural glycoprotein SgAbd-1-like [Eriocheir sinensis]|uniref:endocuticle structural glycoprotein SgAbd-1-like n=1 Tax=Eriocheir sinensis TaxID=95602 RepID=UPI0021C826BB|nr:endocuticle structural glycoprotein SgAbd-1-like [Eriocheir sinensis]
MAIRVFSLLLVLAAGCLARPHIPSPGSAPGGFVSSYRPQRPQQLGPFRPGPGSAPGGIVSSFRPQIPSDPFPGSAPGGIVSSFRPPRPPSDPLPGSAPGGIVSSFRPPRPPRPFRPTGPTGSGLRPGVTPDYRPTGPIIPILVDERDGPHADGSYSFNFETGNGISRYEQGYPQGPEGAVVSQGGWSFTFPDGTPAVFSFVADENGYRVESPLLPTPPPLPAHAIAQIEFARQQKAQQGQSYRP